MDIGLALKGAKIWDALSKVEVGSLTPEAVSLLSKQLGYDMPEIQAQIVHKLVQGVDPSTLATDFITQGHLLQSVITAVQGKSLDAVAEGGNASSASILTRCPFCDNLHQA